MSHSKRLDSSSCVKKSVLLGNGININFGGNAYSNEFIIKRIIFNARAEKYDTLFANKVNGMELAGIFRELATWTNDICLGKYDHLVPPADSLELKSFKKRYSKGVQNYFDIGLEDWIFVFRIWFYCSGESEDFWRSLRQGIEELILDAIFNDGEIQEIHKKVNSRVKAFLRSFECVFTLNYDNNIEELVRQQVLHLHGDFRTPAYSENPNTVQGFIRKCRGTAIDIPDEWKHCYCNALLDYAGENKYAVASAIDHIEAASNDGLNAININNDTEGERAKWLEDRKEHPELRLDTYHFKKLRAIDGEIHIIGMSPNNDSHIFRLIEESNVEKIVYYYYSESEKTLHTRKALEYKSVVELWESLDALPPKYNNSVRYIPEDNKKVDYIIDALNKMSCDVPVSKERVRSELKRTADFKLKELSLEAHKKCLEARGRGKPDNEKDLSRDFNEISRIALRGGILPTALYVYYTKNFKGINALYTGV